MSRWLSSLLALAACALSPAGPAQASCDFPALRAQFDRAAEARDHFLDWEGLDDREADADLERHITRLRALLADAAPDCRRDERGDALLAYASRLLESARKRAPDAALAARK